VKQSCVRDLNTFFHFDFIFFVKCSQSRNEFRMQIIIIRNLLQVFIIIIIIIISSIMALQSWQFFQILDPIHSR
jgi:hypothetical protein